MFLCYHSVADGGPPFLSVPPQTFEHQLHRLTRAGFATGDRSGLVALHAGERPRKPLAFLTFDDGYEDNFTQAFPLLQAYGLGAIIFLVPYYVDRRAAFDWPDIDDVRRAYPAVTRPMTWAMIEQMAGHGIEFGSHTWSHGQLDEFGDEALAQDLSDSRAAIKARVGRCDSIAFPRACTSQRVLAAAAAAGYSFAFTIPAGRQKVVTAMSIPRIAVDHRDRGLRFRMKLNPASRRLWLSSARERLHKSRAAYA